MSIEVEIKLKICDKNRLIESLRDVGFQQGDLVSESDIYYTSRHHDFEKLDEALRIRSIQNLSTGEKSSVITFKGAKTDSCSMTRKELETEVGDPKIAREILESIGFTPVPSVEKERHYFYMQNITACVDRVKNLGDYLELEKMVDVEEEKTEALQELEEVLQRLGYSMEDTTRTSYLSMLMKHNHHYRQGKWAQNITRDEVFDEA